MVEPNVVDERKNEDDLKKTPDSFFENHRNWFFSAQEECPRYHEENRDCRLDPERNRQVERIEKRLWPCDKNRKTCGGCVGKHDEPYTEETEKFDVK